MFRHKILLSGILLLLAFSCISYVPEISDSSAEKTSGIKNETDSVNKETSPNNTEKNSSDTVVFLPEDSYTFWNKLITTEIMQKYKAKNGRTQCNIFMGDILIKYFGEDVFNSIFPDGMKRPNILYEDWKTNKNLVRLQASEYSIEKIQQMANGNYLIIMAYQYDKGPGHVAFVGNEKLKLRTIPPVKNLEGKNGSELKTSWLPVMIQAGTYTGITSMVYASNSWLRKDLFTAGTVCYYLVKI